VRRANLAHSRVQQAFRQAWLWSRRLEPQGLSETKCSNRSLWGVGSSPTLHASPSRAVRKPSLRSAIHPHERTSIRACTDRRPSECETIARPPAGHFQSPCSIVDSDSALPPAWIRVWAALLDRFFIRTSKPFFSVQSVNPFGIYRPTLSPQSRRQSAISIADWRGHQIPQSHPQLALRIAAGSALCDPADRHRTPSTLWVSPHFCRVTTAGYAGESQATDADHGGRHRRNHSGEQDLWPDTCQYLINANRTTAKVKLREVNDSHSCYG
jgi:hypothetical protein